MKQKWIVFLGMFIVLISSCTKDNVAPTDQLTTEVNAIDQYIASYVTDYVAYNQSGIRLVIHHFGNGAPPHTGQNITVTSIGKLFSDSTVFETVTINDKLDNVKVVGLKNALSNLLAGSIATIYIPSAYGYGTTGSTGVPANATLVYDVTLAGVTMTSAEQTQFNADTATIHQYVLNDTSATHAIQHPSGIWYTIDAEGTGDFPKAYDYVSFHYKGTILSNGYVFGSSDLSQSIFSLIDGLKLGIPLIREGGKATFYIPSGFGYGVPGASGIPANANLIFEVQLNSISK